MSSSPRAKTAQACDPCRSLKVRCLPSTVPRICQKCLSNKSGRASCSWAEQKPRRRTSKPGSKARVTELESKLNELINRVDQSQTGIYDPALRQMHDNGLDDTLYTNSTVPSHDSCFSAPTTGSILATGFNFDAPLDLYAGYPRVSSGQSVPDVLLACGMSLDAADGYLIQFRNMSTYFPFVIIPNEATVLSMSQDRPFLCLAALAAATSSEKGLQKRLEQSFRVAILQKIMLDGERNLDLLNGLLVYLAWYHFYYLPKREQSYQLLQMTIGMCVDLGLALKPAEAMARKVGLRMSHYRKADQPFAEHDAFYSREARRSYLGCYYLSTTTAWVTGKPSNLHVTEYMGECAASLVDDMEYPTDAVLLPLVQLQQMAEEHHENLSVASGSIHSREETQRIQTHLNAFRIQLEKWKAGLSPILQHSAIIEIACQFSTMHVHELDLINPFSKKTQASDSTSVSTAGSFVYSIRLDILLVCLKATERFCAGFLELPAETYCQLSFIQWSALIYATVVLYKLSVGLAQVPEWDVSIARSAISLEMFLETVYTRMHNMSRSDAASLEMTDLFSMMGAIFENVKKTYDQLKELPQSESANDTRPVHATSFPKASLSSASPLKRYQHRCPAFPYWKMQGSGVNLFHGVDGFPGDNSLVNAAIDEAFGGFDFEGEDSFWGGTMAEVDSGRGTGSGSGTAAREWSFPSL